MVRHYGVHLDGASSSSSSSISKQWHMLLVFDTHADSVGQKTMLQAFYVGHSIHPRMLCIPVEHNHVGMGFTQPILTGWLIQPEYVIKGQVFGYEGICGVC